jgi:PAS domain S-box-containing protein
MDSDRENRAGRQLAAKLMGEIETLRPDLKRQADTESHGYSTAVVQQAPLFIGIAGSDLRPTYINAAGRRMVGFAPDEDLSVVSILDFFYPDDWTLIRDVAIPAMLRDGAWEGDVRFRHFGGGAEFAVRWRAFSLRRGGGSLLGFATITTDISERKHAEERLRESEHRFRQLANVVPAFVWITDPDGTVSYLNDRWLEYTGQTRETAAAGGWFDALHPDDLAAMQAAQTCARAHGERLELEMRCHRRDGIYRWFASHVEPVRDAPDDEHPIGRIVDWFSVAADVEDRKRAEDRLRDNEAWLSALFSQAAVGLVVSDRLGRASLVNDQYCRMVGRPRAELMGSLCMQDLTDPDGPSERGAMLPRLIETGEAFEIEKSHVRPNGTRVWVTSSVSAICDRDGRVTSVLAACVDATARRRAEQELRTSEERFRLFAENSAAVLWTMDIEQEAIDYVSPAFERVWGRAAGPQPLALSGWATFLHPDDRPRAVALLNRVLRDGEVVVHEYRILRPDGSVRWIRDTVFPIRGENGRARRCGGIAQDITLHDGTMVYVVGGNGAARDGLTTLLQSGGYGVKAFPSAHAFIEVSPALAAGCVLLDVRHPDAGGLAIPGTSRCAASACPSSSPAI